MTPALSKWRVHLNAAFGVLATLAICAVIVGIAWVLAQPTLWWLS